MEIDKDLVRVNHR